MTDGLQALLFVKQLQAMHDFFVLCQSNTRAFVVDRMPPGGKGRDYYSILWAPLCFFGNSGDNAKKAAYWEIIYVYAVKMTGR